MAATDERAIHEFPTGTIDDNSLLIMDRPTATPGEYETEKFAIANLGLKLLGGIDFPNNLDTDEQDIFGAINEVNAKAMNIAREYDPNENWHKGDYCIHENITYICSIISGTTTGTFVPGDWTEVKALEQVKANTGAISELNSGKLNYINTLWANSLESNYTSHSQFIIQHNAVNVYLVWFASTNDVNVCVINQSGINQVSGTGSVSIQSSGVTITRINKSASETGIYKVKVQLDNSSSNGAFTIIN